MSRIYPDIPNKVIPAAKRGLLLHLDKLIIDGKVKKRADCMYEVRL